MQTLRCDYVLVADTDYAPAAELLKALAHPLRLQVLVLLCEGPRCVHELVEATGVAQPLVSQHLRVLRAASVLSAERRGREMAYSIVDDHLVHIVRDAVEHTNTEGAVHGQHLHHPH
jgi:DNA-binding transcriptional ArsR family regulator